MAASSSTSSGFDRVNLYQQVLTDTGTIRDGARSILLNKATAFTATFTSAPGDAGEVWFVQNISTAAAATHTLTLASGVTFDGTNQSVVLQPGAKAILRSLSADLVEIDWIGNSYQELTASGAIRPSRKGVIALNHASNVIAATLAAPVPGDEYFIIDTSATGTAAHTVTLAGTTKWDGTNNTATLNALGEALHVVAISPTRFLILENIGSVALSNV